MQPTSSATSGSSGARGGPPGLRRASALLFLAFLLAFSAVVPRYGWNEPSRAALTAALVDRGTFAIDAYVNGPWTTGDRARYRGHYYSDKIIGTSLLAVPGYALARLVAGTGGGAAPPWISALAMRFFAETLPGAASAVLLFLLLVRLGTPGRSAVLATVLSILGTMWFAYGTTLYPYVPGIAAVLAAMHLVLFPPARWRPAVVSLLVGCALGAALLLDYVFAIAAAAVAFARVWRVARPGPPEPLAAGRQYGAARALAVAAGHALAIAGGALPFLAVFAAYCHAIFGRLAIPYQFLENPIFRDGMARGLLGVTSPSLASLVFITVHPFRGLFFWSPVVAVAFWGCLRWARNADDRRRTAGLLGAFALPAYLLFNSAYYMWWGGWAPGPRFAVPALPLVMPGLAALVPAAEGRGAAGWTVARIAGWLSVALSLPIALTGVNVPAGWTDAALLRVDLRTRLPLVNVDRLLEFLAGKADLLSWDVAAFSAPRWAGYAALLVVAGVFAGLVRGAARACEGR